MEQERDAGGRRDHVRRERYTRGAGPRERHEDGERAAFSRNYRERHLCPREHRGFRDERNYARGFHTGRRGYLPRHVAERPPRVPVPSREEMDRLLAEYLDRKSVD